MISKQQLDVIAVALHDLCQPLTALQCKLELGAMHDSPVGMREGIEEALGECARLNRAVSEMREVVQSALQRAE